MGIQKDCGRAGYTHGCAALNISANPLVNLVALHILLELIDVETKLARIRNKYRTGIVQFGPLFLIAIEPIMHLPKLVLIARRFRGMRRREGILMNLHQRKMMKDNLHLVPVVVFDLLELRLELAAWWALIVAVLFEHYGRADFDIWFRQSGLAGRRLIRRGGIAGGRRRLVRISNART